ncbi:Nodule Cysteine-Rich (NCR) secreted peptide [Medicago truncatula]|uniref:Nodule Cysteine-Rich (NCR) secreted peptide n=2 Tax=Medicago truncatula TaxID=3880 RepID=G7KA73_MEDTR|nr:Nodule Cysteine-Rich (NCR) secreted peptide [Medicago truncatula]
MTKILKCVYAMILFLPLFVVAMEVGRRANVECESDKDCQEHWSEFFIIQCIDNICVPSERPL